MMLKNINLHYYWIRNYATVELFDSKIKFYQDLKQKAFDLIHAKINNKGETKALMLVKKPDSDEL